MTTQPETQPVFHLGIAMAGAVSAGAYTAGVLDYLFETLQRWEEEKQKGGDDVPRHQVVIEVMGGASAGGMCAALAPLGCLQGQNNSASLLKDLWVNITADDMLTELLKTDDINPGDGTVSLLNSACVDRIGEKIQKQLLELFKNGKPELPSFFSPNLEVLLTLFNVSGIKFRMEINSLWTSEKKAQYAFEHRDLAHFRWGAEYHNDGRIPLWQNDENIRTYVQAAKATGAFPVGLSPRKVSRKIQHIRDNEFIAGRAGDSLVFEDSNDVYQSLNADGGTANNEPLELTQEIIKKNLKSSGDQLPDNSSVILIDPFPSFDTKIKNQTDSDKSLRKFAVSLLNAMRSQLLFDAKDMINYYKKGNRNNFMIAPAKSGIQPDKALACGGFGGFSGFINKHYREHDYQLGRRNCQQFLRYYFVLKPGDTSHCAVRSSYTESAVKRFAVINPVPGGEKVYLPIIPDTYNSNIAEHKKPEGHYLDGNMEAVLPTKESLYSYKTQIRKRIRYVLRNLFHYPLAAKLFLFPLIEILLWFLPKVVLKHIYNDLEERGIVSR